MVVMLIVTATADDQFDFEYDVGYKFIRCCCGIMRLGFISFNDLLPDLKEAVTTRGI